ncbi:MAG TPA: haloacid dehalogenase type II [Terriglobales bacterium]|nr:haloacid dehalogenase type II [Terriglobales bacterium]
MARFQFLTFDCYGTLIDWETGILAALHPIVSAHGKQVDDARLLELYGELEAEGEAGPYRPYREVLAGVVHGLGRRLGFTPSLEEEASLAHSLKNWKPWPDTVAALQQLQKKFKLAVLSNIDDDLFAPTGRKLKIHFADVITAQQARCYKPCLDLFRLALQRLDTSPDQVLHIAQSVYHDAVPAKKLGIASVWVNRPSPRAGVGAVKPSSAKADWEIPDLATLAAVPS